MRLGGQPAVGPTYPCSLRKLRVQLFTESPDELSVLQEVVMNQLSLAKLPKSHAVRRPEAGLMSEVIIRTEFTLINANSA